MVMSSHDQAPALAGTEASTAPFDPDDPFVVTVAGDGPRAVVSVAGALDLATAPRVREALAGVLARGATSVVVDLARLQFIDSSGLSVLVSAVKQLHHRGGHLTVRSVPSQAAQVFAMTGLDTVLVGPA